MMISFFEVCTCLRNFYFYTSRIPTDVLFIPHRISSFIASFKHYVTPSFLASRCHAIIANTLV